MFFLVILLAFVAEFIDSVLGMGYGTTLTPILLLIGFDPLQVVPALLLSQFAAGIFASLMHHKVGNVDFKPATIHPVRILKHIRKHGIQESAQKGMPRALIIAVVLSALGIVGALMSVLIAVNLPQNILTLAIAVIIMSIGAYVIFTRKRTPDFSWPKMIVIGFIASFNKGLSGGGYGPLVTGGQVVTGVPPKNAIAITSFSESVTSIVGFIAYILLVDDLDLSLAPFLIIGAVLSTPFAAHFVKRLKYKHMKIIIGTASLVLGALMLLRVQ